MACWVCGTGPHSPLQVAALFSVFCCREGVSIPPARWVCTKCPQCNKKKKHQELSVPPGLPEGERNCCLSHSVTWYHRLSPSPSCMSPATWEVKAEEGRQMGEASGNFSVLFPLWGIKQESINDYFADWECSGNYSWTSFIVITLSSKKKKSTLNSSAQRCAASSQCVARKAPFTAPVRGWRWQDGETDLFSQWKCSLRESTGLSSHSEGSGRPSSGLETPGGNALHSVGARAPVEDAVLVVALGGLADDCCKVLNQRFWFLYISGSGASSLPEGGLPTCGLTGY